MPAASLERLRSPGARRAVDGQVAPAFLRATAALDLLGGLGVLLPSLPRIKPRLAVLGALADRPTLVACVAESHDAGASARFTRPASSALLSLYADAANRRCWSITNGGARLPSLPVEGQPVTLVATVTPSDLDLSKTGATVELLGETSLGTAILNDDRQASLSILLPPGAHAITATFGEVTSPAVTVSVLAATTTTTRPSLDPSYPTQDVTFTATVAGVSASETPTGTVTFVVDTINQAPVTLEDGTAAFSTSALSSSGSPYTIGATYNGDAIFGTSSASLQQGTSNAASYGYDLVLTGAHTFDTSTGQLDGATVPAGSSFSGGIWRLSVGLNGPRERRPRRGRGKRGYRSCRGPRTRRRPWGHRGPWRRRRQRGHGQQPERRPQRRGGRQRRQRRGRRLRRQQRSGRRRHRGCRRRRWVTSLVLSMRPASRAPIHEISRRAMRSSASVKRNWSEAGLPGKVPVTLTRTVVHGPSVWAASTSVFMP